MKIMVLCQILMCLPIIVSGQDSLSGFHSPELVAQVRKNLNINQKSKTKEKNVVAIRNYDPNIGHYILKSASKYQLDPLFVLEVIRHESNFRIYAVSPAGAQGVSQLMPSTAAQLGVNPFNPEEAIDGGCKTLRRLLLKYGNRSDLALAAYNAGESAVDAFLYGITKCCTTKGTPINPNKIKTGGIPPYRETMQYVSRITKAYLKVRANVSAGGGDLQNIKIEHLSDLIPHKNKNIENSPDIPQITLLGSKEKEIEKDVKGIKSYWRDSNDAWGASPKNGRATIIVNQDQINQNKDIATLSQVGTDFRRVEEFNKSALKSNTVKKGN